MGQKSEDLREAPQYRSAQRLSSVSPSASMLRSTPAKSKRSRIDGNPLSMMSRPRRMQRDHFPGRRGPATEGRPIGHQPGPLLHQVAAPVSRLHLVVQRVRQRGLGHVARVIGGLRAQSRNVERKPCAVRSPRPMRRSSASIAMLDSGLPGLPPGNTGASGSASERNGAASRSTAAPAGEWHSMLTAGLHPPRWDRPDGAAM